MIAVLEEAIRAYQRYVTATDRHGLAIFLEVETWLASDDVEWMFSFVAICDELAINATHVRSGLRRWRDGQRASPETPSPPINGHARAGLRGIGLGRAIPAKPC